MHNVKWTPYNLLVSWQVLVMVTGHLDDDDLSSLSRMTPAAVPKRDFSKLDLERSNRDIQSSGSTYMAL